MHICRTKYSTYERINNHKSNKKGHIYDLLKSCKKYSFKIVRTIFKDPRYSENSHKQVLNYYEQKEMNKSKESKRYKKILNKIKAPGVKNKNIIQKFKKTKNVKKMSKTVFKKRN